MRITGIEPQKRNPARRNIYVDGEFALGLGMEAFVRAALRVGDEVTAEQLRSVEQLEELSSARAAAMRLLGVRPRTVREIWTRLREKEFGDEEIGRTVDDLTRAGLLNDETFARMLIRDALTLKPSGKILLRRKLLLLGVERGVVDRVLDEEFRSVDQPGEAGAIAADFVAKARKMRPGEAPQKLRSRTASFLMRRGFGWDVIDPVLRELFPRSERGQTPPENG